MIFPITEPLLAGRLVRRYKRFLADVELSDGAVVTAHCANSGSMLGMDAPGSDVYVRHVPDPKRKLAYTLELIRPPSQAWVGVDTMRPNRVIEWAIEQGLVPGLPSKPIRREVKHGDSRIDLVVGDHFVEVKNATLARRTDAPLGPPFGSAPAVRADYPVAEGAGPHTATFPDAVTTRGAKHMDELAGLADAGQPAMILWFVNRSDCDRFAVARDIDPGYADAVDRAADAGVRLLPLGMDVSPEGWRVRGELPMV